MENQPFPSTVAFKSNDKVITNEDELDEMELPAEVPTDANTVFDNHEMSAQALRGFLLAHEEQLKTIPIRDTAIMNKYTQYRLDFNEAVERIMSVQSSSQSIPFVQTRAIVEGMCWMFSALSKATTCKQPHLILCCLLISFSPFVLLSRLGCH